MRLGKTLLLTVVGVAILLAAAISLTIGWRPILGPKSRPLTARKFEVTAQRMERGQYLFMNLCGCVECHSPHDLNKPGVPVVPGKEGSGEIMPFADLPGRIVAPNITPDAQTGAGNWTDDQISRAIREGIGHDGRALFPMMPYEHYRDMAEEDLASLVVYMRSLPPVHHELQPTEIVFPVKYLIRSVPQPVTARVTAPDSASRLAYGAYLVTLGGCSDCHTLHDKGEPLAGLEFAGGQVFKGDWGEAAAANITPDASGIGYYDQALFMQVMRTGFVKARKLSAMMPTAIYKNLTDEDLAAIFAYLRTLKPVKHRVDNSEPPTYCKLCRMKHGTGDQN